MKFSIQFSFRRSHRNPCLLMIPLLLLATLCPAHADEAPVVSSGTAVLMDADSGQVLYESDGAERCFPASTTKIMTCMLALEHCSLDETVVTPKSSLDIVPGSSAIYVTPGEELTMEQCLHALMMASANDVANAVAEHVAGSLDAFVDMMNARAEEIGATDTHFVNAHGLHSDDHYTTAYDLALISKEAWKLPYFQELIGETFYEIPPTNLCNESRYFYRKHKLTRQGTSLYYEYCLGGKTGYTTEADNTLVSFARKDGLTLIAVSLCCPTTQQYLNTKNLFEYGYSHYRSVEYSLTDTLIERVPVYNDCACTEKIGYADIVADDRFQYAVSNDTADDSLPPFDISVSLPDYIIAPGDVDESLGSVSYHLNGQLIAEIPCYLREPVRPVSIESHPATAPSSAQNHESSIPGIFPWYWNIIFISLFLLTLSLLILPALRRRRRKRRRFY